MAFGPFFYLCQDKANVEYAARCPREWYSNIETIGSIMLEMLFIIVHAGNMIHDFRTLLSRRQILDERFKPSVLRRNSFTAYNKYMCHYRKLLFLQLFKLSSISFSTFSLTNTANPGTLGCFPSTIPSCLAT